MFEFEAVEGAEYRYDYNSISEELRRLYGDGRKPDLAFYELIQYGCTTDLFFLLYFVLGRKDVNRPWVIQRCYEVQDHNDRAVYLWPRFHYKSTLMRALLIQDILKNPEERICIFSHKRAISQAFLREIMWTFEQNSILKASFPHILYEKPQSQAPKWSEEAGIVVKRRGTYPESTIEAWGLVDNLPTSKHFTIQLFDDIVNDETVNSPDQIRKCEDSMRMAFLLMAEDVKRRVAGTIYDFGDPNHKLKNDATWYVSCYSWKDEEGNFVLLDEEKAGELTHDLTDWQISCQMELNPIVFSEKKFDLKWLKFHKGKVPEGCNRYILVDPAWTKSATSDYTVMMVVDCDNQRNYLVRDMIRDRMGMAERWEALRGLLSKWDDVMTIYYGKRGAEQDLEYFEEKSKEEGIPLRITPLVETKNKHAEIEKLKPLFRDGRIWLPEVCWYTDIKGIRHNLTEEFIQDEYLAFPRSVHDDMLNVLAFLRHKDVRIFFPKTVNTIERNAFYDMFEEPSVGSYSWMGL